jgi:hypothetical protein
MAAKSGGGAASSVRVPTKTSIKDSVKTSLKKAGLSLRIANILRAQGTIGGCPLGNVVIVKDSLDHFDVKVIPDTIKHGDTVTITIIAKDAQNNEIDLDGNILLTMTIDSIQYGSFINAEGDTVPSPLKNALYSDAKAEKIKFTGNKTNPIGMEPRRVIIKVTKADDINKSGKDSVYVKRKVVVKIQEHSPWTIWPYLPPQSDGKSRGADRPGYNPKRTFSVLVQDGLNRSVLNEPIKIITKYEISSGGHGHKGYADEAGKIKADTSLPQNLQGIFYAEKKNGNPLQLTTDSNGTVKVDSFRASEASGKYLITARSVTDTTVLDTVNMQIKVPGLVEFGAEDYWTLTGNTSNRGKNHLANHYCTQITKDSLTKALKAFYDWTASKKGGGKAIKLGINDMCLEWGGAFDIPGQWMFGSQHSFHRVGLSVDIDNSGMNTDQMDNLTKIMKAFGGEKYKEPTIHYGFDGGI